MVCLILFLMFPRMVTSREDTVVHPELIENCLSSPAAKGRVVVDFATNPYYLRGDFDADGKPDYAAAIKGRKTRRNGVLVCTTSNGVFLLGADNPLNPPFSDMPGDNFVAPHWQVLTTAETKALGKYSTTVPNPLPEFKGETIAMIWEDGISLIYWDGKKFRWAGASN